MRITSFAAILLATLLAASTASAQEARASVQGFGGVGMGSFTTPNTNFGGAITGDLTPNIQLIGEAGRLGNILPSTTQTAVRFESGGAQRVGVLCAGRHSTDERLGITAAVC